MKAYHQRLAAENLIRGEAKFPTAPAPVILARYTIPAGASCMVRRVTSTDAWRSHRTREVLAFERHEGYTSGSYVFRFRGFLLRIHRRHVQHREDTYAKASHSSPGEFGAARGENIA